MARALCIFLICGSFVACNNDSDQGAPVKLDGLSSKTPANWVEQKPTSNLRSHQFLLPKFDGDPMDAELAIFFFGKGEGGTADANIQRWKEKFAAPQGKKIDDVTKVEKFKVGPVSVTYVDIKGDYNFSSPPGSPKTIKERRPDHRMLGVIFESPNGPYFMTVIGPARTVEQHKKGFDDWLKNFK